jgi:hypothetical protein
MGYDEGRGGYSVREQQQQLEQGGSGSPGLSMSDSGSAFAAGDRGARARRFSGAGGGAFGSPAGDGE